MIGSTYPLHLKGVYEVMKARSSEMPNYWRDITGDPITTTAIAEKMVLMTGLATATKTGDGASVPFDTITAPYNKVFATDIYAIGVELTQKQIGTDQSGKLRRIGEEFAFSLNYAREVMVADIINNGTDATNYPTIVGVALFSASQPSGTGVWSNLSTAAALDILALEQMVTDRKAHKTLKGQKWLKGINRARLITPAELEVTAKRLLAGTEQPGTADREVNVAKGYIKWCPGNPLITDTNCYTLIPDDARDNPLFLLKGNSLDGEVQEDKDIKTLKKLMVAAMDETTGCLYPAGLQHNVGA